MKIQVTEKLISKLQDKGFKMWNNYGHTRLYIAANKLGYSGKRWARSQSYIEISYDAETGEYAESEVISDDFQDEVEELVKEAMEEIKEEESEETKDEAKAEYEATCESAGTDCIITIEDEDGKRYEAVDSGTWREWCETCARNLAEMGWTADERDIWERDYHIYGSTADMVAELMEEN
jgi:hypothetical protein